MITNRQRKFTSTMIAGLAVTGALIATTAHAQFSDDGPEVVGLERIKEIDLKSARLVRFTSTGRSELSHEEAIFQAERIAVAAGANLEFKPEERSDGVLTFAGRDDSSARLDIGLRDGNIYLSGSFEKYRAEIDTAGLPDSKSAPEIAFKQMTELGLLPDDVEMSLGPVGGLNMGVRHENGKTANYRKLVSVRVNRELAGYPVFGSSRMIVHLGEHGRMHGLILNWTDVEGRGVDPGLVLDGDAVMKVALDRLFQTSGDAESIVIDDALIVLYDDGEGSIEPAIRVTATRRYADREVGEQPLDFYIPAMYRPGAVFPYMEDDAPEPK